MEVRVKAAAIYCRVSQDRAGDMLGVERQREDCLAVAERRGWPVVETFVDDDVSAYRRKVRPGYRALLDALRDGRVDAVIAWHPDRLHRSPVELEEFIDVVESSRAQVATVQAGDLDLATPTGRMTARVVGAVARHESEHKAERIRRQREQAARDGRPHGGRRPFGYEPDGYAIRDDEAELVREAATRLLAGESLRAIAASWNARGLRSPSGARWRITTLRSMLAGPRLAGLRVHRGEVVGDAAWPPIIDRDTHERLRAVLGDPRRRQRGRPPVHLLSGFLVCGRCGEKLHASRRTNGSRRYACDRKPGTDSCGRIAVAAAPLEQFITDAVLHVIDTPAVRRAMRQRPKPAGVDHAAVVAECERQLDDLADLFGSGGITRREWIAARRKVEERRNASRRALAADQDTALLATLRDVDPRAAWEALDIHRRRAVLSALIDRIAIRPSGGRRAFTSDRVEVVWKA